MGGAHSSALALSSHEQLLAQLGGTEAIEYDSPYWAAVLGLPTPLISLDPAQLEAAVAPHCRQLLVYNPITHNFQRLMLHVLEALTAVTQQQQQQAQLAAAAARAANSVHLLAVLVKVIAELAPPSSLASIMDSAPSLPPSVSGMPSLLPLYADCVLAYLRSCSPSDETTYLLTLEVVLLVLASFSTQLYAASTAAPPGAHPLAEALLASPAADGQLVGALLALVVERAPPPPGLGLYQSPSSQAAQAQGSGGTGVFRMVRSAAASVLSLPGYLLGGGSSTAAAAAPLSDATLLVLLLLLHYPTHHAGRVNGVAAALRQLSDASLLGDDGHEPHDPQQPQPPQAPPPRGFLPPVPLPGGAAAAAAAAASGPGVSFAALYAYFARAPPSEADTLLLYSLLHGSKRFLEYVLVRSDVETLLLPLLQRLYNAPRRTANQLYMLQIVMLILSQDSSFSHNIHKIALPRSVPWYQERLLRGVSLGSLVYIVLLRSALHNFGSAADLYLPTNTLAALANLAPQVSGLHAHAAQRLVGLAAALAKRYLRQLRAVEGEDALGGGASVAQGEELQVLGDFLRIVLEVINAILTANLAKNPELVYAVLHRQELLAGLRCAPRVEELADNIQAVITYFNTKLDGGPPAPPEPTPDEDAGSGGDASPVSATRPPAQHDWRVEHVLQLVQGYAQGWRNDRLRQLPELRFVYEEEAQPEEFFTPYVWTLTIATTAGQLLAWNAPLSALLAPMVAASTQAQSMAGPDDFDRLDSDRFSRIASDQHV